MSTTSSNKTSQPSHAALSARLTEGAAKEERAHERARHRTKERKEHAQAKERKEKAAAVRVLGLKVAQGPRLGRKLSMESWDGEEPEALPSVPAVPMLHSKAEAPPRTSTSSFTELTLGDLISLPRRKKAKKLDFEVIPPVRAVIALDDFGRDFDVDEPWEYISRASLNDEPTWKGMSYAQAAATML